METVPSLTPRPAVPGLTGRQEALRSLIAAGVIYHPPTPTGPQRALKHPGTSTIATTAFTVLLLGLPEKNTKMIFEIHVHED